MDKKNIIIVTFIIFAMLRPSYAQFFGFQEKTEKDQVSFSYKWIYDNLLKTEKQKVLNLKLKNKNKHAVKVTFKVSYYWQGIKAGESELKEICLIKNETLMGRSEDLVFSFPDITEEQKNDDQFTWEIEELIIEQVEYCESIITY